MATEDKTLTMLKELTDANAISGNEKKRALLWKNI